MPNFAKGNNLNKNSENRMCRLAKPKSRKANTSNLYPRQSKFRQTCKLQNKNPLSPTPQFTLGIIQIIIKSISTIFSA